MQRTYDVRAVRERFPALRREHDGRRVVYLDGPGRLPGSEAGHRRDIKLHEPRRRQPPRRLLD